MGSSILVSEGALRLSGLVFRFRLLRSGLGLEALRCGSPPVRTQLVQQLLTEEVQVQVLQEQAPITSSVNGPPLKFVEDRRGALHRFHLVRLLGLILGDGGGVEPGLNLEGLHRRRVEGSAFLALFAELVAVSMGSVFLPHPMHFVAPFFTQGMVQQGQIQDVGSLPKGRFSRPPYPKPARLPTCCPGVLSRASCSYFILAM